MYQGYLCYIASQWLYRDIDLALTGMGEIIQTITVLKPGYDKSIFLDFEGGSISMEMVKAGIIFESLLYSVTMVIQRH